MDGACVDDLAVTTLNHATGTLAGEEVRGIEVDIHHGEPVLVAHLLRRSGESEASVVAEDVNTTEVPLDVFNGLLDLLHVRHVAGADVSLDTEPLNL